jgi:hypothetical protein
VVPEESQYYISFLDTYISDPTSQNKYYLGYLKGWHFHYAKGAYRETNFQ